MIRVDFNVVCRTQLGDRVFLTGSNAVLGSWKPLLSKAELITGPDDYPRWTGSCHFPVEVVKYKIVILHPDGSLHWENFLQDRELQLFKGMPDFSIELEFDREIDVKGLWMQQCLSATEALMAAEKRAALSEQHAKSLALKLEETAASASEKDAMIECLMAQVQAMEQSQAVQDEKLTEAVFEAESRLAMLSTRKSSRNSSLPCTPRSVTSSASTPAAFQLQSHLDSNSTRTQTSSSTSTPTKPSPTNGGIPLRFFSEGNTPQRQVISTCSPKMDSQEFQRRRLVFQSDETLQGA